MAEVIENETFLDEDWYGEELVERAYTRVHLRAARPDRGGHPGQRVHRVRLRQRTVQRIPARRLGVPAGTASLLGAIITAEQAVVVAQTLGLQIR